MSAGPGRALSGSSGMDDALQLDYLPRLLGQLDELDLDPTEPALPDEVPGATEFTGSSGTLGITETPGAYGTGVADPGLASSTDVVPEADTTTEPVTEEVPEDVTGGPSSPAIVVTSDTSDGTTSDTTGPVSATESAVKGASPAAVRSGDTTGSTYPSDTSNGNQVVEQLDGGQIAGIVLGVAVAAGVIAAAAIGYQRYKRHKADDYITRYSRYNEIEMR